MGSQLYAAGSGPVERPANWRVPGDFSVPVRGRIYYIPIASTLAFSLLVWLVSKVI